MSKQDKKALTNEDLLVQPMKSSDNDYDSDSKAKKKFKRTKKYKPSYKNL